MTRPPSAAASIFPHLPSAARDVVERRRDPASVAAAMYAHLRPQPKPSGERRLEAAARRVRADWAAANARAWGRR
jgi:hypothetical protein